jgi:lauroyl/myristoyl acyltransferase
MGDGRVKRQLHSAEGVAYWAAGAPVLGRLPAAPAYRLACRRGDWLYRRQPTKRAEVARNLRQVLGDELSTEAAQQLTREWFRYASCEAVDVWRLRHGARSLRRLVRIDGGDYLETALAAGKGAILCSAHVGSYDSGFSVLHASGFPVTTLGRWQHRYTPGMSSAERRFWELVYARPVRRLRQRPNIEPWPGRLGIGTQAASVLRANEVLTISVDAPPLDHDQPRTVPVPLLGRETHLLPGIVTLARLTGAPVLPAFLYRSADYCHQVLEISAPLPVSGDPETAFERCVAEVSAAIRRNPAQWRYWASTADLANIGLMMRPDESEPVHGLPRAADGALPRQAAGDLGRTTELLDGQHA